MLNLEAQTSSHHFIQLIGSDPKHLLNSLNTGQLLQRNTTMLVAFNCRETGVSPCTRYRAACTHKSDSAAEELNQRMGKNRGTVCSTQKKYFPGRIGKMDQYWCQSTGDQGNTGPLNFAAPL